MIAFAKEFLDRAIPVGADGDSWSNLGCIEEAEIYETESRLIGRRGENRLFRHNGLHIEVVVDPDHPIGQNDPLGISDVILESALTAIVDLEDSTLGEEFSIGTGDHVIGGMFAAPGDSAKIDALFAGTNCFFR